MNHSFKHFITITFIFLSHYIDAQTGYGVVKGNIKTADGKPAQYVTVGLKGTNFGIETDANGYFSMKAKPGNYILFAQIIGHKAREISIVVKENEIFEIPGFTLNEDQKQIDEVLVTGTKSKNGMAYLPDMLGTIV
jgi:iron complex outermembrane receptor protein